MNLDLQKLRLAVTEPIKFMKNNQETHSGIGWDFKVKRNIYCHSNQAV